MKKLFLFIQGLFGYLFLAFPAFAEQTVDPCLVDTSGKSAATGIVGTLCALGINNIAGTITSIVLFLIVLAVIIALLYLLYGGIKWITSRGEKTEVEAARNHIIAAIVGLIVVFLAIFIVSIILSAFGIGFSQLAIPKIGSTTPN